MSWAWQSLLVSNMVGIESHLAVQDVTMVTDLLALDVPVAYTSLSGIVAAMTSSILVISLSFIGQKYATSTTGKALLLVLVNFIQVVGATLIIVGNMIKLMYYNNVPEKDLNNSCTPDKLEESVNTLNLNSSTFSEIFAPMILEPGSSHSSRNGSLSPGDTSGESVDSFLPFPFYAALVMLGYALAESGFDAGNCFLKTYVIACSSSDIHSSLFVKSVLMGSFGGVFITLLGSLSLGEWLAAGTQYDVDAVKTLFITSVAVTIGIFTLSVSLISGMAGCCNKPQVPQIESVDESAPCEVATSEKKTLLGKVTRNETNDMKKHKTTYEAISKSSSTDDCSHSSKDETGTSEHSRSLSIKEVVRIFRTSSHRLVLCACILFGCWATFSFDVYSVNFVSVAVYQGNSSAPVSSKAYKEFLKGERAGSTGLLLVYLSYMVVGSLQKSLLDKFGWWYEVLLLSVPFIAINFCCSYFSKLWLYYISACMTGSYRVLVYTVPFLLITKTLENEQDPSKAGGIGKIANKNLDIALVATLFPFSFLLAASTTGPLLSVTGSAATTEYITAIAATIALIFYFFIRKL